MAAPSPLNVKRKRTSQQALSYHLISTSIIHTTLSTNQISLELFESTNEIPLNLINYLYTASSTNQIAAFESLYQRSKTHQLFIHLTAIFTIAIQE